MTSPIGWCLTFACGILNGVYRDISAQSGPAQPMRPGPSAHIVLGWTGPHKSGPGRFLFLGRGGRGQELDGPGRDPSGPRQAAGFGLSGYSGSAYQLKLLWCFCKSGSRDRWWTSPIDLYLHPMSRSVLAAEHVLQLFRVVIFLSFSAITFFWQTNNIVWNVALFFPFARNGFRFWQCYYFAAWHRRAPHFLQFSLFLR